MVLASKALYVCSYTAAGQVNLSAAGTNDVEAACVHICLITLPHAEEQVNKAASYEPRHALTRLGNTRQSTQA